MDYSCSKRLSALLRGIISKHFDDFVFLNYPHSFRTNNKLESHKKLYENRDFCVFEMSFEVINSL